MYMVRSKYKNSKNRFYDIITSVLCYKWFPKNLMKLNEEKCLLTIFGTKGDTEKAMKIGKANDEESEEQSLLGKTLDQSSSFAFIVKTLCKKAMQKLHAFQYSAT